MKGIIMDTMKELQKKIHSLNTKIKTMSKKHADTNLEFSRELMKKDDIIIEKNTLIMDLHNEIFRLQEDLQDLNFLQAYMDRRD